MRFWTSRGARASQGRLEEERLLRWLASAWQRRVIHVFDRGWAGGPWLQVVMDLRQRLVERWTSRYHLLDEQGVERKAWEIARGKGQSLQGKLWWAKFGREIHLTIKLRAVGHASVPAARFFLVVASAKEWDSPWYLLTNEPLAGVEDALRIVQIYSRRGPIEWSFRFEKSELGLEHIRVREWEAHLKFLALVTLVYAFLLSLLEDEGARLGVCLLERSYHQTGQRARKSVQPHNPGPSGALALVALLSSPAPRPGGLAGSWVSLWDPEPVFGNFGMTHELMLGLSRARCRMR
jgi:hypothetical protein